MCIKNTVGHFKKINGNGKLYCPLKPPVAFRPAHVLVLLVAGPQKSVFVLNSGLAANKKARTVFRSRFWT
jgi:hypothetical protein